MSSIPPSTPLAVPVLKVTGSVKGEEAIEYSPVVKRGGEVLGALTIGAIGGYFVYGLTCLIARAGMIEKGAVIQPIPYILSGVVSASIVETARLIHDAALYTLGEREKYQNLANPNKASTFDHLRQKTWTIITYTEGLQKNVDTLYSRLFEIRTAEQIRTDFATEKDYYLKGGPRMMEVFRRVFWEQVDETIKTSIPQEFSIYAVEAMGYTIFGGHLFVWLYAVMFINGLMTKISGTFEKIDEEQWKEYKKMRENKATCDLLAALYPYEMAKMEAALADPKMQDEKKDAVKDKYDDTQEPNLIADAAQVVFVRNSSELRDYKHVLNYRHTAVQSTYPLRGFPLQETLFDKEGKEIENDDVEVVGIEKENLPENFTLFGLEESV